MLSTSQTFFISCFLHLKLFLSRAFYISNFFYLMLSTSQTFFISNLPYLKLSISQTFPMCIKQMVSSLKIRSVYIFKATKRELFYMFI